VLYALLNSYVANDLGGLLAPPPNNANFCIFRLLSYVRSD